MSSLRLSTFTLLAALAGCDQGSDPPPTLGELQEQVLEPRCATTACHDAISGAGGLYLEGERAYDSMVDQPCMNVDAQLADLVRVKPGSPEESFLWIKVTDAQGMGDPMPPDELLPDDELDLIEAWILGGAEP